MASEAEQPVHMEALEEQRKWPWGDVPSDKEDFLNDLEEFHGQRGTAFDREPKVSNRHIDLWRLFETVERRGGYDRVSAEKLAWRKLAQEFGLSQAAYAFQVKSIFYRYLAAYAIKKIYGQDPPPKEILEDLTARGGDLLTRTRENFEPPIRGSYQDHQVDTNVDEAQATPKAEKVDVDDPASTGRSGRSLRQAPAPRQIFIPDVSSSRQSRNTGATTGGMQSVPANPNGVNSASSSRFDPNTYDGLSIPPVNLITAITPMNQSIAFQHRFKVSREQHRLAQNSILPAGKGMLIPGTGSSGTLGRNIYARVLNSLRSPNFDDRRWAIHHLVKISEIQGHRFRFDAFSGMLEGLVEVATSISSLYYDVEWRVSYDDQPSKEINVLDGLHGTPDILSRLKLLPRVQVTDDMRTDRHEAILSMCNEAMLVMRNLSFLESNAWFLASALPVKDLLCIVLHLPMEPELNEMRHHALEIAGQVVKYLPLTQVDPLYLGLIRCIDNSQDRGALLAALCAVCRIASVARDVSLLPQVSLELLCQLHSWLLLEDDELTQACLEYFYQYTASPANVASMLEGSIALKFSMHSFIDQLARLMEHNAKEDIIQREIAPAIQPRVARVNRDIPESLINDLLVLQEPDRASNWLRCMFEEDPKEDITQLELWQSYQGTFLDKINEEGAAPLMTAAEFIKNVSTTLRGANARIVNPPKGTPGPPRFIMSGIRYKLNPTGPEGQEYVKCLWKANPESACEKQFQPGVPLLNHVLVEHLGLADLNSLSAMDTEGAKTIRSSITDCLWSSCRHFSRCRTGHTPSVFELVRHIRLHMSESKNQKRSDQPKRQQDSIAPNDPNKVYRLNDRISDDQTGHPPVFDFNAFYDTLSDDRNAPCGIAYWASMTLRNLARSIPKAVSAAEKDSVLAKIPDDGEQDEEQDEEGVASVYWMRKLFLPIRRHIFHVLAYNRSLAGIVFNLALLIDKASDDSKIGKGEDGADTL